MVKNPEAKSTSQVAENILSICAEFGNATAIDDGLSKISYGAFVDAVHERRIWYDSTAAEHGPALFLVPDQSVRSVIELFAAVFSDCVPFISDPTWSREMVSDICATYQVGSIVRAGEPTELASFVQANEIADRVWHQTKAPKDPCYFRPGTAFIRFSSGSSGLPKALEFSLETMVRAGTRWSDVAGYMPQDRVFGLATINNGLFFNTSLLSVFLIGAQLHLHKGMITPSSVLAHLRNVMPNVLIGFPFAWGLLLSRPDALAMALTKCRSVISSSAPLQEEILDRWTEVTGLRISHYYGIAETGPVTYSDGSVPGSVGHALPGVELRFTALPKEDERKELRVCTGTHALGYLGVDNHSKSLSVDADGFYCTGDAGVLDDNGNLSIIGRLDRVANYHGKKFSLSHIEEVIKGCAGVTEACVIFDSEAEIEFKAFVEALSLTPKDIVAHCTAELPAWQIPTLILVVPKLPKSASGKVLIAALVNTASFRKN